jgi:hypothetical protein
MNTAENQGQPLPALEEMKTLGARFVCWKNVPKPGKDGVTKIAKVPFTPDGSASGWTDPMKWGTFQECVAKAKAGGFNGIGMVFNGDGYVGIDIDGCRNPATGEIAPWALPRIRAADSYTEVSPSGTGVKIFLRSSSPPPFAKKARVVEGQGRPTASSPRSSCTPRPATSPSPAGTSRARRPRSATPPTPARRSPTG